MSTNFEVLAIEPGGKFDDKRMVDVFGEYGPSKGAVLCTTELGLGCSTFRGTGDLTMQERRASIDRRLLLQPKVVLESVVDVL